MYIDALHLQELRMALITKIFVYLPLAFTILSLILSALSLSAGHQEGLMEEYAIARVSLSVLYYNKLTLYR